MEREVSLTEIFDEDLSKIIDIAFQELCKNDKDFVKMRTEKCNLVTNNRNIDAVCYEKQVIPLNTEDVKNLIKWLGYKDEMEIK